eukprot:TRINITY_DN4254_c4_g1_i1.p1 TRINITY_DN4254_c4_g1~~TRINITY_DN4254_c4_g1_i1.p1  ORF type:complete len:420 (-),score=53.83 TRINITY_DN4254_c4_g1_i1:84-1343(-)
MPSQVMERLKYRDRQVCLPPRELCKILFQPKFWHALAISLPCGGAAATLKWIQNYYDDGFTEGIIKDQLAYSSLTFFLSFLMVFRVNSAYQKFWTGCDLVYSMAGDLFDGTSSVFSFCQDSKANKDEVREFHQLLLRLVSLLSSLIFTELEGQHGGNPSSLGFQLLDIEGISEKALNVIAREDYKVEIVYQWTQAHITNGFHQGIFSVPPPIVTRCYQDFGSAMVHFHEAQKITEIPFPFPYMAALQILLIIHWILTPVVIADWTTHSAVAFAFSAISTFSLWFFVGIALEMDKPYAYSRNSIDLRCIQEHLNSRLSALVTAFEDENPALKKDYRPIDRKSVARRSMIGVFDSAKWSLHDPDGNPSLLGHVKSLASEKVNVMPIITEKTESSRASRSSARSSQVAPITTVSVVPKSGTN